MNKIFIGVLSFLIVAFLIVGCAPKEDAEAIAGQAIKPVPKACADGQRCGFITEAQLEQKLNDFAKKIDDKSVSGAVFGGCPAGSTSSICINSQKSYCMGSLEHGAQIIDCGATMCSGRFPSGGCWGGDTQGSGEFQKEKPDSTSFGGCPAGSIASVCVDATQMLCIGSEPYGDQLISCGPPGSCAGSFPSAVCN